VSEAEPVIKGRALQLDDVEAAYRELLLLRDLGAVWVTLAAVCAAFTEGDSVWPLLVSPGSSGKSELLNSVTEVEGVWPISNLTGSTLLSGYRRADGKPASLLDQIGSSGILVVKDLTTVLELRSDVRHEVFSQLREVADGRISKGFGTGETLSWSGKLGFVAGVTPVIDEHHAFLALMGERFMLYRTLVPPRLQHGHRAFADRGSEEPHRRYLRRVVRRFISQVRGRDPLQLSDGCGEPLVRLADAVTRARTGVPRSGGRDLLYIPEPESPARLTKQLALLGDALLTIGVSETETLPLLEKIGWDCVPASRRLVTKHLRDKKRIGLDELAMTTRLPVTTVGRIVEDLTALELADTSRLDGHYVRATPLLHEYWRGPTLKGHARPRARKVTTKNRRVAPASSPANVPKKKGARR
jgi:hypothetical protein